MDTGKRAEKTSPRQGANPLSVIVFGWTASVFKKGFKKELQVDDLYKPLPEHVSAYLGDKLERNWNNQLHKAKNANHKPSLLSAILRTFVPQYCLFGISLFLYECVVRIAQPIFLGRLVDYFTPDSSLNKTDGCLSALGIILCSLISIFLYHPSGQGLAHIGMKIRVACCSVIYRKALRLSKTALVQTTVGQVVNLLSNDVNRFDQAVIMLHYLWIGPLQTIIITYYIWMNVDISALAGVGFVLLTIPLQVALGRLTSKFRLKTALRTDERVRLMNEIISGIQVIKMYTWEKPFSKLVSIARRLEIRVLRRNSYIHSFYLSSIIFTSRVAVCLTVVTYILIGNVINAEKIFTITSFYNVLQQSMTIFFPQAISQVAEVLISIKRLQTFLLYEENNTVLPLEKHSMNHAKGKLGITIRNATAKWDNSSNENTLSGINIEVVPGRLVAIIGPVGSGKTSLLHAVLGELSLSSGSIQVNGRLSYASQEPWLFAASVQQNILFGETYDREKYNEVVKVCALKKDFKQLPYRDLTIVGERGVSLSGGQRARVNLARAVYHDADVYILDDPLSAVDTHVGKQLFEECVTSYLKNKTVILVTHQLQYLKEVDQIVILDNGCIAAQGTYKELIQSGLDFAELLANGGEESTETENTKATAATRQLSVQSQGKTQQEEDDQEKPVEIEETRSQGSVGLEVYKEYFRAGGNCCVTVTLFLLFVLAQLACSGTDYWMSFWTNQEQIRTTCVPSEEISSRSITITCHQYNSTETEIIYDRDFSMFLYVGLVAFTTIIALVRSLFFFIVCMRASMGLHDNMFYSITRARMRFFDTNPSGRILNRFSKDMGAIDEYLPQAMIDAVQIGLTLIGILTVVATVNYWLLIPTAAVGVLFYVLRIIYLSTSRNVKRLEGITRSPVFSHLNASLQGLTTIRAFGAQGILQKEFDHHQDLHSSAWFLFVSTSRAFGFWLDCGCMIYITLVTLSFLVISEGDFGGDVGLAITQSIGLTGMFQWGMRQSAELENQMTSVERVLEYSRLEEEPPLETSLDKKPPNNWPEHGEITFDDTFLRYSSDTPPVLKGLSLSIKPREKIGIVGRTGAGKSSLIVALFRLAEVNGSIYIDDVDTKSLGLHDLRSKISIIPQDPVLFSGTLRKNLDPFDEYPDDILWRALEDVHLKEVIDDLAHGLMSAVSEGGSNFSVGQRQLICLARAIIRNNKILLLDEATANVDPQTDALIQVTIRSKFLDCTVLTIAHRLHTVMDSDKVLVMDAGKMVEFDQPHSLLQDKDGFLHKMVHQTGSAMEAQLHNVARQSFLKQQETFQTE